jgi:hypothetical protein
MSFTGWLERERQDLQPNFSGFVANSPIIFTHCNSMVSASLDLASMEDTILNLMQ